VGAPFDYFMPLDTTSPKKAAQLRIDRIAEIKRGERTAAGDKLTVSDLLDLVVTDYRVNNCRSLEGTIGQLEAVRVALGTRRASDVATEAIKRMQASPMARGGDIARDGQPPMRQAAPRLPPRAAGWAAASRPVRPTDEGAQASRALHPAEDLASFNTHLPAYVLPLQFAHLNGTRRGQLARTQRRFVDLQRALIAWPPAEVKADDPHTLPLEGESLASCGRRCRRRGRSAPTCGTGHAAPPAVRRRAIRLRRRLEEGVGAGDGAGRLPVGRKAGGYTFHHLRVPAGRGRCGDCAAESDGAWLEHNWGTLSDGAVAGRLDGRSAIVLSRRPVGRNITSRPSPS
jgi:integrase